MAVSATYVLNVTAIETLAVGVDFAGSKNISHDQLNSSGTLNASSTVPATKVAAFSKALSDGAATIDLTALTGTNGAAVDFTGLKVQLVKFKNPVGNAAMTIKFGAANPYNLLGASWTMILLAGQEIALQLNDAAPDVAAGAKNIDISGTGTQTLQCLLVAG